jgi:hypothetical protein
VELAHDIRSLQSLPEVRRRREEGIREGERVDRAAGG